ncbi:MAG: hypothetical protein M1829_003401 [Trizodia sp. TS-e1964]|nr:MAG: hypothetical protein M1829_003401 [Trizodia sp. TS-e1964]
MDGSERPSRSSTQFVEDYRPGYPRFTALLSAYDPYFICRRFSKLRARLLLLKQDQISVHEQRLEQLDREEASPLFLGKSRCDGNRERISLLSDIESCLSDYDQFIERTSQMLSIAPAQQRDVKSLQNWLDGTGNLARDERAYLTYDRDLVTLAPAGDSAIVHFEAWVEDKLIYLWRDFRKNRLHNVSNDRNVYIYSGRWIQHTARVLLLFLITLLLLMPATICIFINSISARIAIIMIATILYLLVLFRLTRSRTMELVLAGATVNEVDETPVDHPERANRLHHLGIGYQVRYQAKGAIADLEAAIQKFKEALDRTPEDHPDRAQRLQSLGISFHDRYQAKGAMADLEAAIQLYKEALDRTPEDHPERAQILQNLGSAFSDRYRAKGAMADLEAAIQLYKEALDRTPEDHPDRAQRLQTLGTGYGERYRAKGAMADLEAAIQKFKEALDRTPEDHPERAQILQNLGSAFSDRYRAKGAMADLEAAIQLYKEALDRTPEDHPDRAQRLQTLGIGYKERYQAKEAMADLEAAIQQFKEALDGSFSLVGYRLNSGTMLLALYADDKNWLEAFQTAVKTIHLVPLLTPRSLEASDKQRLLGKISGLASDAAAVALNAAKIPFDAIQLLELGRDVIGGSLNELRADISELQQKHPELAEEHIGLRDQLDTPESLRQRQADQRHNAVKKLDENIEAIRALPGFDRFLLAPSEDELKTAAAHGPIVIINISKYRCDALIIEKSGIQSLELSRLDIDDILNITAETISAPDTLQWLWNTITRPVLDTLGFTQTPSAGCWPRIWWIPTGLLSKFPLHAAGYHTSYSTETALDRVISSYSSSIKAIIYGRRQLRIQDSTVSTPARALLIAMEHTPGSSSLPSATGGVERLHDICQSMELVPLKSGRCKEDIMSHLPHCDIFHFAGHGHTDNDDPSESYLLLEDWTSNPLTVTNLLELNLRKRPPFLAYLSACGTGQIKDESLTDESIHLISACQLAGYRHVIGTLWDVHDETSMEMARITYETLRDGGLSDESVSWGLHKAAREIRKHWLSMSIEDRCRSRLAREEMAGLRVSEGDSRSLNDEAQRGARQLRNADPIDENGVGRWVPYVHYGV